MTGTAAAAASLALNYTGKPSDYHKQHGPRAPWCYRNNIQTKQLVRVIILALHLFFLLGTQMCGSWRSSRMCAAPLVNSTRKILPSASRWIYGASTSYSPG